MKKIVISFFITVLVFMNAIIFPVSAQSELTENLNAAAEQRVTESFLFRHKLEELYPDDKIEVYDEPYYHFDSYGLMDWALVRYRIGKPLGPLAVSVTFGRTVVSISNIESCYLGLSVYDVKRDEFIPIADGMMYHIMAFDDSAYEGFDEALAVMAVQWSDPDDNVLIRLLGDTDGDKEITILDATYIQRSLAGLKDRGVYDETVADFDKSGDITILDATAIQRFLAGLE